MDDDEIMKPMANEFLSEDDEFDEAYIDFLSRTWAVEADEDGKDMKRVHDEDEILAKYGF